MEELFKKVYQEKLKNGEIEKIISEQIDKVIKNVIDICFGYSGTARDKLKEKIELVINGAIENSDFSKYTTKITTVINEALESNQAICEYNNVAESLKGVLNYHSKYQTWQEVKLSDLFKSYVNFIENRYSFSDFDETGDEAYITCYVDVDDDDDKYYREIKFINSQAEEDDKKEEIFIITTSDHGYIYEYSSKYHIPSLQNCSDFQLELLEIINKSCRIKFDKSYLEEEISYSRYDD